jgi:hypothetical protein
MDSVSEMVPYNFSVVDPVNFRVLFRPDMSIEKMRPLPVKARHNFLAYQVTFEDAVCGDNGDQPCSSTCDTKTIQDIFIGEQRSVADFYAMATRGFIQVELLEVTQVVLPRGSRFNFTGADDFVKYVRSLGFAGADPEVDHHALFIPRNFRNMPMFVRYPSLSVANGATVSPAPDVVVAGDCYLEGFLHEFGHQLGLAHAGASVKGRNGTILVWQDTSSVMGASVPWELNKWMPKPYAYRGFSLPELFLLGVVKKEQMHEVRGTVRDLRFQSLSSNAATGFVGARVQTIENNVLWLEWREPINQDEDLTRAFCKSVVVGRHTETLIIRHIPEVRGLSGIFTATTTVDAILRNGTSTVLPLTAGSRIFAKELSELKGQVYVPSKVPAYLIKFLRVENGEAVVDVLDIMDASVVERVVASVVQVLVQAEVAIDGDSAQTVEQFLRFQATQFDEKVLPFYASVILMAFGGPSVDVSSCFTNYEICQKEIFKNSKEITKRLGPVFKGNLHFFLKRTACHFCR